MIRLKRLEYFLAASIVLGIPCLRSVAWAANNIKQTGPIKDTLEANKRLVTAFYDLAFNQHQSAEAMNRYVGAQYTQHNPSVADGKQPFIDFFTTFHKKHPAAKAEIKRVIAEGDLVVLHVHSKVDESDRGRAVIDIFRVKAGKIVEHWDVAQPVPESAANSNTMF